MDSSWTPGGLTLGWVQVESTLLSGKWTPLTPCGSSGVHLESWWNPGGSCMSIWLCSQPKKMHLDSRCTLENHLDSGGVHLEDVGQDKVLRDKMTNNLLIWLTESPPCCCPLHYNTLHVPHSGWVHLKCWKVFVWSKSWGAGMNNNGQWATTWCLGKVWLSKE